MIAVVDASVFNKLFLDEADRAQAHDFFHWSIEYDISLLAPHLLLYEALSAALHYNQPFERVAYLLKSQRNYQLQLIEPDAAVLASAYKIATHGHPKSGYPSLTDSLYHALAIETGGTLVTADRRHLEKTKAFGHAILLSDWEILTQENTQ